jgi:preprotein translocase subunit SecG
MTAAERSWWWRCAGAGLIVILTSLYFGQIPNIESCAPDSAAGNLGSIIAFELVRSPADVAALFGTPPCTDPFLAAMRHATWVDALLFIPAYSAFLICALIALRGYGGSLAGVGIAAAAAAALFDQVEGFWLFMIMDGLPGSQGEINWLIPAVRAKFVLLGVAAICIGVLLTRHKGMGFVFGAIIALGGAATTSLIADDGFAALTVQGSAVAWVALFVVAVLYAVIRMNPRALVADVRSAD